MVNASHAASLRAVPAVADLPALPTANDDIDWARVDLPVAWPDAVDWRRPAVALHLLRKLRGKHRERVRLPEDLPGAARIPHYMRLEFHNLPNGNYSHRVTYGYSRGFDRAMLGTLRAGRRRIADALRGASSALDLGSGAGYLAAALREADIGEVWGLEPSPYLLRLAAQKHAGIRWVQGPGECSGLPEAQFDAIGICFVLHEIPPHYLRRLCAELHRITKPGARLAILEPSPLQWRESAWTMWRTHGWRGAYFRLMAKHVYEPFADAWHKLDFPALLAEHGFAVTHDETGCPFRFIVAERRESPLQETSS